MKLYKYLLFALVTIVPFFSFSKSVGAYYTCIWQNEKCSMYSVGCPVDTYPSDICSELETEAECDTRSGNFVCNEGEPNLWGRTIDNICIPTIDDGWPTKEACEATIDPPDVEPLDCALSLIPPDADPNEIILIDSDCGGPNGNYSVDIIDGSGQVVEGPYSAPLTFSLPNTGGVFMMDIKAPSIAGSYTVRVLGPSGAVLDSIGLTVNDAPSQQVGCGSFTLAPPNDNCPQACPATAIYQTGYTAYKCQSLSGTAQVVAGNCSGGPGHVNSAIGCIPYLDFNLLSAFFIRWSVGVGGGIALFIISLSAIRIITTKGDPKRLQDARDSFSSALAGIIFLVLSIFIVRFVADTLLQLF